jgi:lysophospholipase L1-like esterase
VPADVAPRSGRYVPGNGIYNLTNANTRRLKAALGRAMGNTGYCNLLFGRGDSLTASHLALPSPDKVGWPMQTAHFLEAAGVPAGGTGWIFPYTGGSTPDGRLTTSGLATFTPTNQFMQSSTSGAYYQIISDQPGTTVDVAWVDVTSGSFTVSIDGTVVDTITPGNSAAVKTKSYTGQTNATHTVKLTATSASATYYLGAQVRQASGLLVTNPGIGGTRAGQWLPSDPTWYNPGPLINGLATAAGRAWDAMFLMFMLNDMSNGDSPATFQSNLTAIATADLVNSDVILGVEAFPSTGTWTAAQMQPYRQAVYNVADALSLPLIDFGDLVGPYTNALANGLRGDTLHLNGAGYSLEARAVAALILAV